MRAIPIFVIRLYQRFLSPLTRGCCRHVPSCSNYAIEAFERHGLLRGAYLSVRRVLRCHPLGTSGLDPVP